MSTRLTLLVRALAVALLVALTQATPAVAQDDDDDHDHDDHHHGATTATSGASNDDFGAFIRQGSCDQPGDVVEDIGDLDADDDVWSRIGRDEPAPDIVYGEDEDVHRTVDELASGTYVVTIHERDDAGSAVIACGEIAGDVGGDGTLMIDLDGVDGSGFVGRAHFAPEHDDDDDETEVTVGVWAAIPPTPRGV